MFGPGILWSVLRLNRSGCDTATLVQSSIRENSAEGVQVFEFPAINRFRMMRALDERSTSLRSRESHPHL
jgi:hypothetical protein